MYVTENATHGRGVGEKGSSVYTVLLGDIKRPWQERVVDYAVNGGFGVFELVNEVREGFGAIFSK